MRHRYPGVRGRRDRARDAGHDLEGNARVAAGLGLFAAAAEHERVAALQAHDFEPVLARDEQLVDLLLRHRGAARRLADVDELGTGRREVEQRRRREPVVDHNIGAPQQLGAASVSRPGSPGPAPTR